MATSAHRLHDLLQEVQNQVSTSVSGAWGKVLDVAPGSAEFARRHAHAVVLLADTARDINALPVRSRDRHLTYLPAWWRAVIGSDQQWNSSLSNPAQSLITASDLDHLANAGDLIEATLTGTSLAPAAVSLEQLAADVEGWQTLLGQSDDLPAGLAAQLRAQMDHLLWLIDQSPRFGVSSVARQADETLGALTRAFHTVKDPATRQKWKTKFAATITAITLVTAGPVAAQQMLEATAGTVRAIEANVRAVDGVHDAVDHFGDEEPDVPTQPLFP